MARAEGAAKSDPEMWDRLCDVVESVQSANDEDFAKDVFRQVLLEIYAKLATTKIKYDIPLRVSLEQVLEAIRSFLDEHSGGDRALAIAAALFGVIGSRFQLFAPSVRRARITAADKASGQVADLECVDSEGQIVMAVEVKDRTVTVSDLEEKLPATRNKDVKEIFFVSARGKKQGEDVPERVASEFAAGQNIYVFNVIELATSVLALAGEASRRQFLSLVGGQLDEFSDTKHRLAWKRTLQKLV